MKVMVIGSGGREHALAWRLAQSPRVEKIWVAPGNAGTSLESGVENVDLAATDIEGLLRFASEKSVDLTVVGPEAPLVVGIVDTFVDAGLAIVGPIRSAAKLEGSKTFAKQFMIRHRIPTASARTFEDYESASRYVSQQQMPLVIKADGLAAGKGVVIAYDRTDAEAIVADMLAGNVYGEAGHQVLVEQFLEGEEVSFICLVDRHQNILPLASSQDHKTRDDGDLGPNTGGMGAYSPSPIMTAELTQRVMKEIIEPTVSGLASEGILYTGFLYAGLMIDQDQNPHVLEFNCRFGDPETQPIMMRLKTDLADLLWAAWEGELDRIALDWDSRIALGTVLAAQGYPETYSKGEKIDAIPPDDSSLKIFHAGTGLDSQQNLVTTGGRVLCVTALADTYLSARERVYSAVDAVDWSGKYYRTDIGFRAINYLQQK